ncbi:MAG TPA: 3'-5' exonuclease, partial [Actinomycetota bacterium]|nr:3'-5' exonuclease [Actinomycetota bacterium]
EVQCFLAADDAEEAATIAEDIVALGPPWSQRAVLCRKRRLIPAIADALEEASIPVEVVGSSGLLDRPEVVDLIAWLEILADPSSSVALLRILQGPKLRIGHRDLAALARHVERLRSSRADGRPGGSSVVAERTAGGAGQLSFDEVAQVASDAGPYAGDHGGDGGVPNPRPERRSAERAHVDATVPYALVDSVEDVAGVEGLSPKALAHLAHIASQWEYLARAASRLPLIDLAELVAERTGLWSAVGSRGRDNLLRFLELAQQFQPVEGVPGLAAFLDYLRLLDESEEDLAESHASDRDAVAVLTIHQAKGLEWDCVWVPGLAGSGRSRVFPDERGGDNPLSKSTALPWWLSEEDPGFGDWQTATKEVIEGAVRLRAREEEWRLLYVACTRARLRLVCSAAQWYPGPATPQGPSEFYNFVAAQADVVTERFRHDPVDVDPQVRQMQARGARSAAPPELPATATATTTATAQQSLFHQPARALRPVAPATVTVTELVSFRRCPRQFYWLSVNPLPQRASPAALIGSQVHRWIEQQAAGQPCLPGLLEPEGGSAEGGTAEFDLLAEEPLEVASKPDSAGGPDVAAASPGVAMSRASSAAAEAPHTGPAPALAGFQAAFTKTPYAALVPVRVEAPFVLSRSGRVVRGRVDAMYERDGQMEVVDFKTGRRPDPGDPGAEVQLHTYAIGAVDAWRQDPDRLRTTYCYLGDDGDYSLASSSWTAASVASARAALDASLRRLGDTSWPVNPGSWCRRCP